MKPEDSKLIHLYRTQLNRMLSIGYARTELRGNDNHVLMDALSELPYAYPVLTAKLRRSSERQQLLRRLNLRKVRRALLRENARPFAKWERMLGAAEVLHRDLTFGVFGKWLHVEDGQERYPPLFGFDQLFGGPTVKFLLLLSLQARCINISNEVLTLLRDGHAEAAAARTRSLWELVVTSVVLVSSREENGWEITDRYYLSTLHEMQKDGFDGDPSTGLANFPGLTEKIRDAWGKEFFDQYGWARPLIPNLSPKARVTFRHLEEAAGGEDFRFLYREFNHAVHSGATNTVTRLDARRPDINPTRPTADFETTARVGWACTRFSTICLTETSLSISAGTSEWDSMLSCWEVHELSEEIIEAFDECIHGHSHD